MEIRNCCVNVCRLCAETTESKTCIPLFTEDKRERIVTKQINQLVANLVSLDDGLPQEICLKCSKNVELCYSFVSSVVATQNKLKRLILASKQKAKCDPSNDEYGEHFRFENVTAKGSDRRTNKKHLPKSTPCINTGYGSPDSANINHRLSVNNLSTSSDVVVNDYGVVSNKTFNLRMKSFPLSLAQKDVIDNEDGSQLNYLCGVCSKKFINAEICSRHILASHPSVGNSLNAVLTLGCSSSCETHRRSTIKESHKCVPNPPRNVNGNIFGRKKHLAIDSFCKVVRRNCVKYACNVCGRLMTSWFAFKRHLLLHIGTECSDRNKNYKRFQISAINTPFVGYCKVCNKLVEHFRRHNAYHAIIKLEFDYPDFVKLFSI